MRQKIVTSADTWSRKTRGAALSMSKPNALAFLNW